MPNLTVYYPDAEQRDATKDMLAALAVDHGLHTIHKSVERGSVRALLGSIVSGEIALVLLGDEQRMAAINELRRLADDETTDWIARDAFRDIADALSEARARNEAA